MTFLRATSLALLAASAAFLGCGGQRSGGAGCGIAALAGPSALLGQFGVPNQTLSVPPARLPERTVARLVAGPTYTAIVGRTQADSQLVVGVDGTLPAQSRPQFGVLVLDPSNAVRGVMIYESQIVEAAPVFGSVSIGGRSIPLIGVQADPAKFEQADCPFFPDSVLK